MRRTVLALLALATLTAAAQAEPCRTSSGMTPAIDSRAPMKPGDAPRKHCDQRDGGTLGGVQTRAWEFTMKDSSGREVERVPGAQRIDYYIGKNMGAPGVPAEASDNRTVSQRNSIDASRTGAR